MNIQQRSRLMLIALSAMCIVPLSWGQTQTESIRIEQAKAALEDVKSALEDAQNTLDQAESAVASTELESQQKPAPNDKAKTPAAPQPLTSTTTSNRLYKWVDDKGKVSYQDSPPPKNVKVLNSDVLKDENRDGKSVKELRSASTPVPIYDGSTPVMVYTADNCKPCQSVVLFLTQKQVPFIERDIRNDRNARNRLSKVSKQITVPSLFIGDRVIQGNVKPVITRALEEAGYLEPQR